MSSGGLELIIKEKAKKITIEVEEGLKWILSDLVHHIATKYVAERPELFAQDGTVYVKPLNSACFSFYALSLLCSCSLTEIIL